MLQNTGQEACIIFLVNMEGLELIRLFSDSKEKFVELNQLLKKKEKADITKLAPLKEWFEGEIVSVEQLLADEGLKFVDRMMLEKLEHDYKTSIKKIDDIIN